ncbi:MAG: S9 family peptidase, partial [Pseudomonadota bacterium]|nr:S9 family peptidase [Pseudomonadota bacterium]
MKYLWIALAAGGLISGCSVENKTEVSQQVEESSLSAVMLNTQTRAPVAKKVPHELTAHSVTRNDNYYWMRDDSRTDKEILAHLDEENSYVETVLAPLKGNREALYEELVSRIEKDDSTVPVFDNGYWYYTRYSGENEYPIYLRKPTLEAEPSVLLDANIMSEGHDYFSIGSYAISSDNKLLAYSEDTLSRRIYTIFVKDLESGDKLNDVLEGTSGRVVWANDNTHLFYVKKDPQTLLGYQVYRHKLGTAQSDDTLIYEESDPTFYTYISKSKDSRVIYIHHNNTDKTGVTLVDANDPTASTEVFFPLKDGQEYSVAKAEDGYYVLTNIDAKNFRIMKAPLDGFSDVSTWQEVVAHRSNVFLQNIEVFKNHLVVKEKENGMLRMVVHNLTSGEEKVIPTQDPIYGAYFNANPQMDTNKLRIFYSSLTTPGSIIDVNLDTLESEIMKQTRVSDTFDSSAYASERVMIEARDGAEVPVSLVYRKDKFKKDGTNPLYQYAYGSYGATIDPTFRSSWLSLIDRGFVVAIAHIRGGQMLGRQWYEDGKMFEKMNTFTDYIDVTKGLVEQQYADKTRVFAMGGSAGGLLMGAVVNMAPELYLGVSAHVPFVDVVTTMSDASIPLTTGEYTEWG